jgi:hypothetical protein
MRKQWLDHSVFLLLRGKKMKIVRSYEGALCARDALGISLVNIVNIVARRQKTFNRWRRDLKCARMSLGEDDSWSLTYTVLDPFHFTLRPTPTMHLTLVGDQWMTRLPPSALSWQSDERLRAMRGAFWEGGVIETLSRKFSADRFFYIRFIASRDAAIVAMTAVIGKWKVDERLVIGPLLLVISLRVRPPNMDTGHCFTTRSCYMDILLRSLTLPAKEVICTTQRVYSK